MRLRSLIGLAAFFVAATVSAEWVPFESGKAQAETEVKVLVSNDQKTVVEINIEGMQVERREENGTAYDALTVSRAGLLMDEGKPQMPVILRLIAIPATKNVEVKVLEAESKTLTGYNVFPAQRPPLEGEQELDQEFVIDQEFYTQNALYPEKVACAGEPMIWRDYRVVQLRCSPVQFNPATKELKVCSKLLIELKYSGVSNVNVPKRSPSPTPRFEKMYQRFIINYDFVKTKAYPSDGQYLILTHDAFYDVVQPLAYWKHKKGLQVHIVKQSEVTDTTGSIVSQVADIQDYVENCYDTWTVPPEYILLVGDGNHKYGTKKLLPPDTRNASMTHWTYYGTDYPYSLLAGSDNLADVFLARLPAETVAECSMMIHHILRYETDPYLGRTDFYTEHSGFCIDQVNYGFDYSTGIIGRLLDSIGFTQTDSLHDATAALVKDSIEVGRGVITYRGHGGDDSWKSLSFDADDVLALSNGEILPVVIAVSCNTNAFCYEGRTSGVDDCMGEAFLRNPEGAICYFGGTNSLWAGGYTDTCVIGVFMGMCTHDVHRLVPACDWGKAFMYECFPATGYMTLNLHALCAFGDPELNMWLGVPKPLDVTHLPTAPLDPSSFEVTVLDSATGAPLDSALVCLMKDTMGIYERGYTDASGNVSMSISPPDSGPMWVTVTARSYIPYQGFAQITETGAEETSTDSRDFELFQPTPNSSNSKMRVKYGVPRDADVVLSLYDISGRMIETLYSGTQRKGYHTAELDSEKLAKGIYFVQLKSDGFSASRKFVYVE